MIASQALIRLNKNNKFEKNYINNPVILQIGGNNERELIESCQIAKKFNYNSINLNIGFKFMPAWLVFDKIIKEKK